ncbi:MAG: C40 family peptidase [Candidatus Latescibacterota bacterium]|nr:MAG: C40 family peptidase [Candidatus Latescibacterota bacterium]
MLDTIHKILARSLADRGLDWRSCYVYVHPEAPDGRVFTVECTDGEILDDLKRELGDTAAVRLVSLPDPESGLPEQYVVLTSVADVRKKPSHAAELITQVIGGYAVTPIKTDGDWILCRMDDAYIGWIRSWCLKSFSIKELRAFEEKARHRVRDNVIKILDSPELGGLPVCDAVSGTRMAAMPCGRRGWRAVEVADGREGFVRADGLEPVPRTRRVSRRKLRDTGLRFLGIPYVWGGTSTKGFDCSGLIQHVFRLNGMLIPRDSDQQSRFGSKKSVDDISALDTGDLLFFGKSVSQISHVAMYLSDGVFLHSHGQVRLNALVLGDRLYDDKLVGEWKTTRDPLKL